MANFGIGLGGFVSGLQAGYGLRSDIDDRKERRERQKVDDEWQAKSRARQEELWGRQDKDYQRQEQHRSTMEQISTDTKEKFDAAVADGTADPDDFDKFWNDEALPEMKNEMLRAGDIDGAKRLMDWSETADAKKGRKLFASAMLKANTGDSQGALDDVIEAGKLAGYIDHGMDLIGQDVIKDPSGNLLGYRLKVKTPDGKEVLQDIRAGDLPNLIATFANPEAAWASQQEAAARRSSKEQDIEIYRRKKEIDKELGIESGKARGDAISALRKRMDGGLAGDEPKFDDLPREQQEKLIATEIELQTGEDQPGIKESPKRKVIVDTVTGKVTAPEDADRQRVSRKSADTISKVENSPEVREKQVADRETQLRIQMAQHRLNNLGDDPKRIAADLEATGTPRELWPPELLKALQGP